MHRSLCVAVALLIIGGGCDLEKMAMQAEHDADIDRSIAALKIMGEDWAKAEAAAAARATAMPRLTTTFSPVEPMTPLVTEGVNAEVARTLAALRCVFTEENRLIQRVICLEGPPELTCENVMSAARDGRFKEPVMVQLLSMTKTDVFVQPDTADTFAHTCNGVYDTTTGRRLGPMPPKR